MRILLVVILAAGCGGRTPLDDATHALPDASPIDAAPPIEASPPPPPPPPVTTECTATTPVVLASVDEDMAIGQLIAGADGYVYFQDRNAIWRVSKAGGKPTVVAPDGWEMWPSLASFALEGDTVAWVRWTDYDAHVARVASSGGTVTVAGPAFDRNWTRIALLSSHEHVWGYSQVMKSWLLAEISGDDLVSAPSPSDIAQIVQDGDDLFASSHDGVARQHDGVFQSLSRTPASGIAVDATDVYFARAEISPHNAVLRMPKTGGTETVFADLDEAFTVVLDATNVYATDRGTGSVLRLPKAGGKEVVWAEPRPLPDIGGLAIDDTCIYWASIDSKIYASHK
jgi:hypothetical protein